MFTYTFALFHFFPSLALTKLDILDTLSEIKVGVAYTVDGKPLDSFPGELFFSALGMNLFCIEKTFYNFF